MTLLLTVLAGGLLAAGGVIIWLLTRTQKGVADDAHQAVVAELAQTRDKFNLSQQEVARLDTQNLGLHLEIDRFVGDIKQLKDSLKQAEQLAEERRVEAYSLEKQLANLRFELQTNEDKLQTQAENLREMQTKFKEVFENLANKIFEEKTQKFTQVNQERLTELLSPFKIQLKTFEEKVDTTYRNESQERIKLVGQIEEMSKLNMKMSMQTENLTSALKGNAKVMGDWGEMLLEEMLQNAGLTLDVQYKKQPTYAGESGNKRLDFLIKFPDGRNLIIDSKVSLVAYERYHSSQEEAEKASAVKDLLASLRSHITTLSETGYQHLEGVTSPDYLILFIPLEPAYLLAMHHDRELFRYAWEKKVVLTTHSSLYPILKTVEYTWKQHKISKNALAISKLGGALYDKFAGFLTDWLEVEKRLKAAQEAFDGSRNKLSEGHGNLLGQVVKLQKLGLTHKKRMPGAFANVEEELESLDVELAEETELST